MIFASLTKSIAGEVQHHTLFILTTTMRRSSSTFFADNFAHIY